MEYLANPSYIESDYMSSIGGEQIAGGKPEGVVAHPVLQAKRNREAQAQAQQLNGFPDQAPQMVQGQVRTTPQFAQMPSNVTELPYAYRSGVAPYSLNYPEANLPSSLAWGAFDETLSAKATPFKTALATSSLIILGAVIGEIALGGSLESVIGKKADKFYSKNKLPVGMGALVGAITANAIRMGVASQISSGWKPALTSFGGGMIPATIPIALTILNQDIKTDKTKIFLVLGGVGCLSVPLIIKLFNK